MKYGFSYNRYTKNQQLFGEPGGLKFYWRLAEHGGRSF